MMCKVKSNEHLAFSVCDLKCFIMRFHCLLINFFYILCILFLLEGVWCHSLKCVVCCLSALGAFCLDTLFLYCGMILV